MRTISIIKASKETRMLKVVGFVALFFLAGCVHAVHHVAPPSDEPEHPPGQTAILKTGDSYERALEVWKTPEDIHGWISAHFSYDKARALRLSENQRTNEGRISIYDPSKFFDKKNGVCVDLARFGVESLRRIDPGSNPKYLMIEFDPIQIESNLLRRHWLASFRRDGEIYFFADSKRPGHMAGPYCDTGEFIREYERYRGRKILNFRELESYQKQRQMKSPKLQATEKPIEEIRHPA